MDQQKRLLEFAKYEKAYKDPKYEMRVWRRRRFEDYLKSIENRGYVSMLDVGCGRGQAMSLACQAGYVSVVGVEVVESLCDHEFVHLVDGAHSLPYEDGWFDLVVATDVMEHILEEDVQPVLKEMFRVASKAIHLTISHRADKADELGHKHVTLESREWWLNEIWKAAATVWLPESQPSRLTPVNFNISVESDELTPPIKMPCTHLEIRRA